MENYKEKYEQALENIKKIKNANKDNKELVDFIEYEYPELKESEDERVKNEIIAFVEQSIHRGGGTPIPQEQENRWLAWLEKQGEQKPAKSRYETKPNGSIIYEDFNKGDGYYKVNLAYLSKSQVELIENLVASWQNLINNTAEWSEEDELNFNQAIYVCHQYQYVGVETWLKSLKQRMKGE